MGCQVIPLTGTLKDIWKIYLSKIRPLLLRKKNSENVFIGKDGEDLKSPEDLGQK
jgi:site-specific recombinase XerD